MNDLFGQLLEGPERDVRTNRTSGLVLAEVSAITDDGFELIFDSIESNEDEPPVARLATLMAGHRRGSYFAPEEGDEVIVGFVNGDLDEPVILGALWNDQHDPPPQADTQPSNNRRCIVSRSGHEITFDDTSNSETITIKSKAGAEIVLEANGGVRITTAPNIAATKIVLDGVSWFHQHATGTGPSGPPVPIKQAG